MVRFKYLERFGVTAAMSTSDDGDCALVDDRPNARAAREGVLTSCGLDPRRAVGARQVHGIRVAVARGDDAGSGLSRAGAVPETDGFATTEASLPLTITIADCVPLFLLDPIARVGALVHAGRVGTQNAVARQAVCVMKELGAAPERIVALIGPSAGPCCYEVSETMARELDALGATVIDRCVDLWTTNHNMLVSERIPSGNIQIDGRCTICRPGFHSHRRDANGMRNMALLAL